MITVRSVSLGILATLLACASAPRKYRSASRDITTQLVDQLEKRTDPRHVRVLVRDFKACKPPGRSSSYNYQSQGSAHSEAELARQIKHQLMSALARELVVMEGDWLDERSRRVGDRTAEDDAYPDAKELGATAVLVGNYAVTGKREVLLMARLVDTETNEILATAEETIRRVRVPHRHG